MNLISVERAHMSLHIWVGPFGLHIWRRPFGVTSGYCREWRRPPQ